MLTVKRKKLPLSGELLNEVKLRGSVQILDLARLNALDAKARLVGNSDVFFVEHCTPPRMGSSLHSTGPSRSTRVMICFAQARCTAAFTQILASSIQPIMHSTP